VVKAFTLLQSFRRDDEWLTSSELSRRARLPEASGYRLVQTLEGLGAVVRDARGRYRPGMLMLSLGRGVVARDLWGRVPQALLDALARAEGAAVHVGVLEDGVVNYVARAGAAPAGFAIAPGMQFEAYPTAIGKVLLAALDDDALARFLGDGELVALTERTITCPTTLSRHLEQVRVRGYAVDDRETLDTLCCVAAPIRGPGGRVAAALSVSVDAARADDRLVARLRGAVGDAAQAVGERLFPWADARA
jgi:DNA-binding IclR family transcriptional regulator